MALTQTIKLTADASEFQRGVAGLANTTNKAFKSVGAELSGRIAGAFTAAALIDGVMNFGHSIIEAADNIGDMADNLELSVEEVQRLGIAAQLAGTKFGRIERVMRTIQALRDQALAGDKAAMEKFQILGINPAGQSPLELVRQMIAAGEKSLSAQNVVADTFKANLTTIKNTLEKLNTMGPVNIMTEREIERLGQAVDNFAEMARTMKVTFAPILVMLLDMMTNWLGGVKGLFTELQNLAPGKDINPDNLIKSIANTTSLGTMGIFSKELSFSPNIPAAKRGEGGTDGMQTTPPSTLKPTAAPLGIHGDALSRIGLFVGGGANLGDRLVTIGGYQLTQLRGIREELRKLNE